MFEARLVQGNMLKKILEAIKELVAEANLDCSSAGISLQAMDLAHVSLVHLMLRADGFDSFRCDRSLALGINMGSMSKVLKCAGSKDAVTLKAEDEGDEMTFVFESPDQDRVSDFQMKLMDIDAEQLGIPETEYTAVVHMPSSEYQRICKDLSSLSDKIETVTISATKEGVKFSVNGDFGSGNVVVNQNDSVDSGEATLINLEEPVELSFNLRYLTNFAKAASLSPMVTLSMKKSSPLVVEYKIEELGYVRYYLAPKMDDEDNE
eukprot:gb/GECH01012196.1/.p1 GENE.gb/GECH01012196.1/~~gb/GECH01012196.1/.p1  ORF type:complete len:264 (+),score=55.15 gb/GECH01012196.1/:1-792(+)